MPTPPAKPRVALLLIGAIVVVVALYLISAFSKSSPQQTPTPQPTTAQQSTGADLSMYLPEDDGLAEQSTPIKESIDAETDPTRQAALRGQLVELYASNGRLDLAGREQENIAQDANTAEEWAHAGNFHFDWMEQQSGDERVKSAQRAVADYLKSLEIDPDNLDVRTDLGVAYLNDPASPMLAIRETNAVLEKDPNHVQANFNKAVMLLQIGRNDEAVALLEKVLTLSEPGSSPHDRAVEILNQIRSGAG